MLTFWGAVVFETNVLFPRWWPHLTEAASSSCALLKDLLQDILSCYLDSKIWSWISNLVSERQQTPVLVLCFAEIILCDIFGPLWLSLVTCSLLWSWGNTFFLPWPAKKHKRVGLVIWDFQKASRCQGPALVVHVTLPTIHVCSTVSWMKSELVSALTRSNNLQTTICLWELPQNTRFYFSGWYTQRSAPQLHR